VKPSMAAAGAASLPRTLRQGAIWHEHAEDAAAFMSELAA